MVCPKCGKKIPPEVRCPECGCKLQDMIPAIEDYCKEQISKIIKDKSK